MKILLVEDNPKTRVMIRKVLGSTQPDIEKIIECEDENEAVDLYARHNPNWVLMDIGLKTGSGLKATERIVKADPEAKVVIVTLFDDVEYRKAAEEAGALKYVLKDRLLEIAEIVC